MNEPICQHHQVDGCPACFPAVERDELDRYYTPPELTRALLERVEWGALVVGEPCCGEGWIVRELVRYGHQVVAADVDHHAIGVARNEFGDVPIYLADIFSDQAHGVFAGVDAIVSNPPYLRGPAYVRRMLEFTPRVAVLMRSTFLEPCEGRPDSARTDLLATMSRAIIMPRRSFYLGGSGTDSVPPAWCIWGENWPHRRLDILTESDLAEAAGQQSLLWRTS